MVAACDGVVLSALRLALGELPGRGYGMVSLPRRSLRKRRGQANEDEVANLPLLPHIRPMTSYERAALADAALLIRYSTAWRSKIQY